MTGQGKTNKKRRKINQFGQITIKEKFLKISVSLRTVFAVAAHQSHGQWLE
jgi:hypothetical protein